MSEQIYFPVYKRIEKEVLELSYAIYFTDDHVDVYSTHIADLILRCSVELESIAKDIYRKETEKEPTNPGECFLWIEQQWKISKKAILIDSPYFHFKEKFSPMLYPFGYKNNSNEDYYSQYNAIKHDRVKNLYKANIYTLIRVLGALYILNIYYCDEKIMLSNDKYGNNIDKKKYSEIFTFNVAPCVDNIIIDSQKGLNPENCIYRITRKESDYAFKIIYKDNFDETQYFKILLANNDFQQYAKSCLEKTISIHDLVDFISKLTNESYEMIENNILNINTLKEIISVESVKMKSSYWAELNK